MFYSYPESEAPTERLIHIYLEPRPSYGGDHRHINTRVVRRAKEHEMNEDGSVSKYWDGKRGSRDASGYRSADWTFVTPMTAVVVRDFGVRGQIDAYALNKVNDGKPYGNEPAFDSARATAQAVKKMHDTFHVIERRVNKLLAQGHSFRNDDFETAVRRVALALGIKKFIVHRKGRTNAAYDDPSAFVEFDLSDLQYYIDHLLGRIKEGE